MKTIKISLTGIWLFLALIVIVFSKCSVDQNTIYTSLRNYADQVKVINTHEHQRLPEEFGDHKFGFYHVLSATYLNADLNSAGANRYNRYQIDTMSLEKLWDIYGEPLNYSRSTSYYGQFVRGVRKLYDFDSDYFTKDNIANLSLLIEENYKGYKSWFNECFYSAGFELMFLDQYWNPFNTEINEKYFALVFPVNNLISNSSQKPDVGALLRSIYSEAENAGYVINDLDDYLAFCEYLFNKNVEKNVVSLKNSQAYSRTLYYEDVSYDEAMLLYNKPSSSLTPEERKKIEDFMFHWIIRKSIEYDLPVQIHTGYLAGNGNILDNGQPIKLNNLFLMYPQARFVLFHGGFPWTGEYAALGKMFSNVYLDLVWLPQISRQEAVNALDVILDCVPYNKLFWGGDCQLIEESVGSLEFGKDIVAEVLTKRVERGLITEDTAFDILNRIFRENAIEVFKLEEKLGRKFKS